MSLHVTVDLPIQLAVLEFEGIRVGRGDAAFAGLSACAARCRAETDTTAPGAVPGIETARTLFRTLGIDPTRRRPSSEAMLRRALKDQSLPQVNDLVDVGNWCSLDSLLPLGVYDRDRVRGGVVLRQGRPGESYAAISNRDINLDRRYLLADDEGPFGSPMTDSKRTCVTEATTNAAVFIYAPADFPTTRLEEHAGAFSERVERCCGGRTAVSRIERGRS